MNERCKLLWHSDYWDGPLSGMCMFEGKKCWMHCTNAHATDPRCYVLFELSEEEVAEEEKWHALFEKHVGTHTSYNENGHRHHNEVKPRDEWEKFYIPHKDRVKADHSNNKVLYTFTENG